MPWGKLLGLLALPCCAGLAWAMLWLATRPAPATPPATAEDPNLMTARSVG